MAQWRDERVFPAKTVAQHAKRLPTFFRARRLTSQLFSLPAARGEPYSLPPNQGTLLHIGTERDKIQLLKALHKRNTYPLTLGKVNLVRNVIIIFPVWLHTLSSQPDLPYERLASWSVLPVIHAPQTVQVCDASPDHSVSLLSLGMSFVELKLGIWIKEHRCCFRETHFHVERRCETPSSCPTQSSALNTHRSRHPSRPGQHLRSRVFWIQPLQLS